jgi:hypothetical protein
MKKIVTTLLIMASLVGGVGLIVATEQHVMAADCDYTQLNTLTNCAVDNSKQNVNTGSNNNLETSVSQAIGYVMWAVGIVSVVIIIISGIQYALAAGDEAKVKKAKKMLIGALVGLAVAILAFAITDFVVRNIK